MTGEKREDLNRLGVEPRSFTPWTSRFCSGLHKPLAHVVAAVHRRPFLDPVADVLPARSANTCFAGALTKSPPAAPDSAGPQWNIIARRQP